LQRSLTVHGAGNIQEASRLMRHRRDFMKKLLLPLAMIVAFGFATTADAQQCRNAKGQFAKCGTPGAVVAGAAKAPAMKAAGPAMKPAAAAPAMAPAKAGGPCKDAKGKFIKCGAAAAPAMKPAAPAMAPAMKPAAPAMKPAAAPAMAPAKKAPCKDSKGKFIKCAA
jgi:hypothetical protein